MKIFTILLVLLLLAGTATAENYLVFLTGDSRCLTVEAVNPLPTIYRDGVTIEVTEVAPVIVESGLDEYNPGCHNEAGAIVGQESSPHDFARFCIGCNDPECLPWYPDVPLVGEFYKGTRLDFYEAIKTFSLKRKRPHYEGRDFADRRKPDPTVLPLESPLKPGDVLDLWIQGTGGEVCINGEDFPCFFFALPENCHELGGDPFLPWELAELLQWLTQAGGKVNLYLAFAYCGAWDTWVETIPGVRTVYGAGPTQLVYIADNENPDGGDADETLYMWNGENISHFYALEPVMHIGTCLSKHLMDNTYNPYRWDSNGDYYVYLSELGEKLDYWNSTGSASWSGEDYRLYRYDDEEPRGGDNISVGIWPNPFNPTANISLELSQATLVHLSVYNIMGQQVIKLVDGHLEPGYHSYLFSGSDLTSGIYFVHGELDGALVTRKMWLVK